MKIIVLLCSLCFSINCWGQEYSKDPSHYDICQERGCIYLGICQVDFNNANEQILHILLPKDWRIIAVEVRPLSYSHFIQEGNHVYITVNNENLDTITDWSIRTRISLITDKVENDFIGSYNYFYHLDCNVISNY